MHYGGHPTRLPALPVLTAKEAAPPRFSEATTGGAKLAPLTRLGTFSNDL